MNWGLLRQNNIDAGTRNKTLLISKKIHDNLFSVKRMRSHRINAKMNEAIFEERTNPNEYGHGIRKNSKTTKI